MRMMGLMYCSSGNYRCLVSLVQYSRRDMRVRASGVYRTDSSTSGTSYGAMAKKRQDRPRGNANRGPDGTQGYFAGRLPCAGTRTMPVFSCRTRLWLLVFAVSLVAACASREVLVPKSASVPPDVDFSATWRLRKDSSGDRRAINAAIRATDGVRDRDIFRPLEPQEGRVSAQRPPRNMGGLVHVFLQHGNSLKITQTAGALFLSFDRAVVEEFRFGEHRQVRVGPVLADRVSGWEGDDYVVETLDQEGMKLTERFSLINRHTLQRIITFRSKGKQEVTVVQTFDRVG